MRDKIVNENDSFADNYLNFGLISQHPSLNKNNSACLSEIILNFKESIWSYTTDSSPVKFYSIPNYQSERAGNWGPLSNLNPNMAQRVGSHSSVLKEPADVIVRLFTIRFERFWRLGEGPDTQERPQTQQLFSKRLKTNLGDYQLLRLTSAPWEIMENILF